MFLNFIETLINDLRLTSWAMIPLCWQHGISLGFLAGICPEPRSKWDLPRQGVRGCCEFSRQRWLKAAHAHIFVGSLAAMYCMMGTTNIYRHQNMDGYPGNEKSMKIPNLQMLFPLKRPFTRDFPLFFSAKHDEPPWVQNGARIT